jgi:YegS/Rv2252/BmrU family lipid kinase
MDKEKALLVIHPKAEKFLARIVPVLEERWDVMPQVTEYAGHGIEIAANAQEQGYRWVIALGGDGTLNEVVNGVARSQGCCTVGILPGGTANQWAHEIGLPAQPVDAAHALLNSAPRRVDIGCVEVRELVLPGMVFKRQEDASSPTARNHFLLTAGLGLDAAVIERTADSFRQHYGQLAFYLTWLESFPHIQSIPAHIQWSSDANWEGQPREILVSNTRHYGSVVDVAPEARVNDGLLDIRLFWYTEVLFHYVQDRSFLLRIPASVAMHLDGSPVELADYLSQENREHLWEATDLKRAMVTYRFAVKPEALCVAIPREYAGDLFDGTRQPDTSRSDAPILTSATAPRAGISVSDATEEVSKTKAFRATRISADPLSFAVQGNSSGPFLHIGDVILRENNDPAEIFAHLIRMATGGVWSHSALLCSFGDPPRGVKETFLIESRPRHTQFISWRDEVVPFDLFSVGIKRPCLDWYVETPEEASRHDPADPEDRPGIDYLQHVCGIAVDQINGLYDYKAVFELAALYLERIAKRHLGVDLQAVDDGTQQPGGLPHAVRATTTLADLFGMKGAIDLAGRLERRAKDLPGTVPSVAELAARPADFLKRWKGVPAIANFFEMWKEANYSAGSVLRFICSGLEQYSYFEALRRRIMYDLAIPAHRDAAMSNLENMGRVLFRDDSEGLIPAYVQQIQSGKRAISDPVPGRVLNLLKTAVPMDFDTSPNLEWRYIIRRGVVWRVEEAAADYTPQSEEEREVLAMLYAKHALPD